MRPTQQNAKRPVPQDRPFFMAWIDTRVTGSVRIMPVRLGDPIGKGGRGWRGRRDVIAL